MAWVPTLLPGDGGNRRPRLCTPHMSINSALCAMARAPSWDDKDNVLSSDAGKGDGFVYAWSTDRGTAATRYPFARAASSVAASISVKVAVSILSINGPVNRPSGPPLGTYR